MISWCSRAAACAGIAALLVGAAPLRAQTVVAPNALSGKAGEVDDALPLLGGATRFQQVYDNGQFASLTAPEYITQIAFRPFAADTKFTANLPQITIRLSTTSANSTSLSPTFASNITGAQTLVYSDAPTITSKVTPLSDGTTAFDIVLPLQTPFLYDPSKGSLLLDVTNATGTDPNQAQGNALDATTSGDIGVARVFGNPGDATGTVDRGSSSSGNDAGVVTQFTFSRTIATVPEAGTAFLFTLILAPAAGVLARRRTGGRTTKGHTK